jgi:hypothetical protein
MAQVTKTVKFQGTFAVVDATNVPSPNKFIKDLTLAVDQVQSSDPMVIPAATTDFVIPFGGITVGKRVYLKTDQEVTIKFNEITDDGFPWRGEGVVPSDSGITGIWISTGPNATTVEIVVAGD